MIETCLTTSGRVLSKRSYSQLVITSTSNGEIFIHDFLVILKHLLQNYSKIWNTFSGHWCVTRRESVKSSTTTTPPHLLCQFRVENETVEWNRKYDSVCKRVHSQTISVYRYH